MDTHTNEAFTAHLRNAIMEAERLKYYPNDFKRMVGMYGGFDAVNRVLAKGGPSTGFEKLWGLHRLDLSCEAIVVESKWRPFFDPALVMRAEALLRQSGYAFTPFQAPAAHGDGAEQGKSFSHRSREATVQSDAPEDEGHRCSFVIDDLNEIKQSAFDATTKMALIDARLGQGRYRRELMHLWGGACAVTGLQVSAVLRASHCKPWRASNHVERLDPANGLLLGANLDALFDAGLISFECSGEMLVAEMLKGAERQSLGVPAPLRSEPSSALASYLEYHRKHVFVDAAFESRAAPAAL